MRPRSVSAWTWALLLTLILCVSISVNDASKDGLYSTEDDDVLPLNTTTLMQRVIKNQENIVWVVEFYNSWCGHCIKFAPTWKKLAVSLKGWHDLVKVAALDCSQSVNLEACRKFEIDLYPSMKLFSPTRVTTDFKKNQVMRPMKFQELDKIIHHVINFMTEVAPSSWPRLKPLSKIEEIWSLKTDAHKYVALVFEENTSVVGRKVVLDMRHTPNVLVCVLLKESVTKFGVTQFPSLYQLNSDSTYTLLGIGTKDPETDHRIFVNMLKTLSKGQGHLLNIAIPIKGSGPQMSKETVLSDVKGISPNELVLNNSLRVSMTDLESALHYTFRQEIAICKSIGGAKFSALEKFVQVLLKYFPGREPIMKFLQAVSKMLTQVTSKSLSGEEWITNIDSLQSSNAFLPEIIEWDCCKGSQPRYRGYPCAMWTLFHMLTVGAYSQQKSSGRPGNPLEIPLAIRGYMDHFFGCAVCSKHFLQMASTMEKDITDSKEAVLWLWRAHNKVNIRLKGDDSEDKAFPKIQFPPPTLCLKCQTGKGNASTPEWNVESVLEFLTSFYSGENIFISPDLAKREFSSDDGKAEHSKSKPGSSSKEELDWWEKKQRKQDLQVVRDLRNRKREKLAQKRNLAVENVDEYDVNRIGRKETNYDVKVKQKELGGMFSDLDLSMCVVFYVFSTAIILGLYHHFIVRRKTLPCNIKCLR